MRKTLIGLLVAFISLTVFGCVSTDTVTTKAREFTLPDELPTEDVTILFWHVYGQGKSELLDDLIADFEAMYPNVTVDSVSQTDYTTILTKIRSGLGVEEVPTLAIGYPDHFAEYVSANAVFNLDTVINTDKTYEMTNPTSSIYQQTVTVGVDLNDFVPSYLSENNQYEDGHYYTFPYSKSTETMAVNRSVIKAHVSEIRAAGIEVSDEGFFSHTTPLTYAELEKLTPILVDTNGVNKDTMQCQYLMNYDSPSNLFINASRQWRAPYTNSDAQILINNDTTRSMISYLDGLFQNNTLVLPIKFSQNYGSTNFTYGDICFTVGSTAGVTHNIPAVSETTPITNFKLGLFDVDFLPVPQFVANTDDTFTVADETYTGSLSAVQQGPSIGIFSSASDAQILYSWLFIKFLTDTENTAAWAMDTGYLPVRLSGYASNEYASFLQIAQDFWAAKGAPTWEKTDSRWNKLYSSMVANIAQAQVSYYQYDPAFAATSKNASSATTRIEAGYCLENIYTNKYEPEKALDVLVKQIIY